MLYLRSVTVVHKTCMSIRPACPSKPYMYVHQTCMSIRPACPSKPYMYVHQTCLSIRPACPSKPYMYVHQTCMSIRPACPSKPYMYVHQTCMSIRAACPSKPYMHVYQTCMSIRLACPSNHQNLPCMFIRPFRPSDNAMNGHLKGKTLTIKRLERKDWRFHMIQNLSFIFDYFLESSSVLDIDPGF